MSDESRKRERGAATPGRASTTSPEHSARPTAELSEQELALAAEHPRGTERRRLLPYRDALNDPTVYARLPEQDRDVIVRWAEVRRRIAERGIDHDEANLADPLLPAARLRGHVLAGEQIASGVPSGVPSDDDDGDLIEIVLGLRARTV